MRSDLRLWLAGLAFLAAVACAQGAAWFAGDSLNPDGLLVASLFGQALWAFLALSGALALQGVPVPDRLGLLRGRLPLATCALLVLGFVALSYALHLHLTAVALRDTGTMGQLDRMVARSRGPSFGLTLITVAVAPAFAEELLFRGFLQQSLSRWLGPWLAVPLAAVAFGVAHWDPVHSTAAVGLGLYLGVVVALAGSVRPAIACHLTNNLLAVLVNPAAGGAGTGGQGLPIPLLLALSAGALTVATWVGLSRASPPRGSPERFSEGPGTPTRGGRDLPPDKRPHEQATLDTPDR